MIKKIVLVVLAVGSVFLCGCDNSKRIDKAILIDCIVVTKNDYTFVCISDEEKNELITIKEESLEKALKALESEHNPEVVLSKLELIAFAENTESEKYYSTLQQIKNNYAVSPSVYTAVCSNEIIKSLDKAETVEKSTEQIMLFENKERDVSSTLLKMNNNLSKSKKSLIYLPYIRDNNGTAVEKVEIMIKK